MARHNGELGAIGVNMVTVQTQRIAAVSAAGDHGAPRLRFDQQVAQRPSAVPTRAPPVALSMASGQRALDGGVPGPIAV